MRVTVEHLGPQRLVVDGEPLSVDGARQRQFLAVLASGGPEGLTSEQILHDMYPDDRPPKNTSVVRMAVRRARALLGADVIKNMSGRYMFDLDIESVDTWRLAAARSGRSSAVSALAQWRGPPFEGVTPTVRIATETERLRILRTNIACDVAWRIAPGADEGLAAVLSAADDEPFDESLAAAAAAALYRVGRQVEALGLLGRCRESLRDELGLDPGSELRSVELAILEHDHAALAPKKQLVVGPTSRPTGLPTALVHDERRFVGRTTTHDELTRLADSAMTGPGALVLIEGEAGQGKSAVLASFLATFGDGTSHVVPEIRAGFGGAGDYVAYAPIIQAVPELVPDLAVLSQATNQRVARLTFWEAAIERLSALGREGLAVVVLEDVDQADSQSALFLQHLAGTAVPPGVLLVVTARLPVADESWARTRAAVNKLRPDAVRQLEPLTIHDVESLVAVDHPNEDAAARRRFARHVHQQSAGNPLVASLLSLHAEPGLKRLGDSTNLTEIGQFEEYVVGRFAEHDQSILTVAALIGGEFNVNVLTEVAEVAPRDVLQAVERARNSGICAETSRPDVFRFNHALTTAAFANRAISMRRATLYARLAEHPTVSEADRVRYVIGAGALIAPSTALSALLSAADRLQENLAFSEAVIAYQHAIELLDPNDEGRFDLLLDLAICSARANDPIAARTYRALAVELAREDDDHDRVCRVALSGLPDGEFSGGESDRIEMLEQIDPARVSPEQLPTMYATWIRHGRVLERREVSRRALEAADRQLGDEARTHVGIELERLLLDGAGPTSVPLSRRLADLAARMEPGSERVGVRRRELLAALREQDPLAATSLFDAVDAEARDDGSHRDIWAMKTLEIGLDLAGMRDTSTDADEVEELARNLGIPDGFPAWAAQRYVRLWLGGRLDQALAELDALGDAIHRNVAWEAGRSLAAAATGDVEQAVRVASDVARQLREAPDEEWSHVAALLLVEASHLLGDRDHARLGAELLQPLSGHAILLGLGAAHFGPADRCLGMAALVTGDADPSLLLTAAVRQSERTGATVWARRTRLDLDRQGVPT